MKVSDKILALPVFSVRAPVNRMLQPRVLAMSKGRAQRCGELEFISS